MIGFHIFSWSIPFMMCVGALLFGKLNAVPNQLICLPGYTELSQITSFQTAIFCPEKRKASVFYLHYNMYYGISSVLKMTTLGFYSKNLEEPFTC